jgi:hypothetical protein
MYGTSSHWTDHSRERQLWCAVIDRALQDATRHPADWTALTKEQARERAEARRWFAENSAHFRHACESAGFDADVVRKRVLELIEVAEPESEAERPLAVA